MPSDFNSATPNSAWYVVTDSNGQYQTVSTTGNAFVRILQGLLRLMLTSGMTTYDGSTIRASDITVDGNWGPNTYKGLWAIVNDRGGSQDQLTIIQANAEAGAIPRDVVEMVATLISANIGTNARLPSNANLPPYRRVAGGFMAPLSSRPSTTDEIAAVGEAPTFTPSPDTGTPSAPAPSPPAPAPAPAPSPIQIDTTTGLPTNVPTTVSQGSSIPWGTIVAVGVGVVALGAVALSVKSSQVRGNPAMYGPRVARVYLEREYLDRGGYTRRGRYFGVGAPLYLYTGEGLVDKNGSVHDYVHDWVRAADRKSAMQKIRERFPNVRFSGAL